MCNLGVVLSVISEKVGLMEVSVSLVLHMSIVKLLC